MTPNQSNDDVFLHPRWAERHGVKGKPIEQFIAEQRVKWGLPESWPESGLVIEVAPGVFEERPEISLTAG